MCNEAMKGSTVITFLPTFPSRSFADHDAWYMLFSEAVRR
ncbi:hypothetical protein B4113_3465 [Geobacillus sp. B4113_201601]|nr:hypothetical protein B4113_3465 [Geobacillus sp. B4113_201601]